MRELVKCPLCSREDTRVLLRPHWSKKFHEFICGHCKTEFMFKLQPDIDVDVQLKTHLDQWLMQLTGETMEQAVQRITNSMTPQQMTARLEELNTVYH